MELELTTKSLSIDVLVLDADTQSRLSIHDETVLDYAELIEVDTTAVEWPFPPVDVFHDGSRYMVADGFHRVLAAAKTKRASIPCIVHKGTATDALFFAMTANDNHGLRMTRADKRANVELLLDDYPKMTQKLIAETVGVCVRTVKSIVADRKPQKVQVAPSGEEGRTELDGTEPTEETSPSEPRSGKELAGEDDGQEFVEMDYEEDRVQTALKAIGGGPTSAKPDNSSIVLDAIGRPVPEKFIEAHGVSAAIQVQARKLDSILRSLKELSTEPGGDFIPQFDTDFGDLKGKIFGSCYWSECPKCKGVGGKCYDCKNKGWWPKEKSGHLSVDDKAWLGVE